MVYFVVDMQVQHNFILIFAYLPSCLFALHCFLSNGYVLMNMYTVIINITGQYKGYILSNKMKRLLLKWGSGLKLKFSNK